MKFLHIGKQVCKAQNRLGISNREFARRAKTSPQQILRWRKNANMKFHTIQRICDVLQLEVSTFLDDNI